MSKEYETLLSTHELYDRLHGQWRDLLNGFMGGQVWANAGYLTRYSYESETEYVERLNNTPLDNHCKGVINVYNSFLFRDEIVRDFGTLVTDPSLEPFLEDADLEGRSFDAFMKDVSTYSSVFGHCYMLLTKPQTNARTRAEELAQAVRPYVNLLTPLTVLDWRWTRAPNGVYYISYFKYLEDSDYRSQRIVKEWTEEEIRTSVLDDEHKLVKEQMVEINQLGRIPVVCVYGQRGPYRGAGISDIEDIFGQQKAIYNEYSEIEQSIRISGHPSLVKTADVEAVAGAGAIIQMPENMDPGLRPYMLSVETDTNSIYTSIQHKVDAIDRMANTGSVRALSTRTLSGTAMEVEFAMLNSRLSSKADNLEVAEENLWRLFARYQDRVWDGEINYPDSFAIHDVDRDFNNLTRARQAATDPRVLALIDHEIIELLGEDADMIMPEAIPSSDESSEFQPHAMMNPQTGEVKTASTMAEHEQLTAEGWQNV